MKIVIATNVNGIGLERDHDLLRAFLLSHGHEVASQQYDQPAKVSGFDVCIWLEVINEHLIPMAKRHWIFVNPEWTKPEYLKPIQRHCDRVFAKTREAEVVLRKKFANVTYTGFLTTDKMDRRIGRASHFLHIGGNSGFRNTLAVVSAWQEFRYWGREEIGNLTVISKSNMVGEVKPTPGLTVYKYVSDEDLKELQNSHLFHLFPSAYEGFGQALHEAQSVGAIILTTAAAPMNEIEAPFTVPSIYAKPNNLGTLHEVSPADIRERAAEMFALPSHVVARMQIESRARFDRDQIAFSRRFLPFLATPTASVGYGASKPRIALLGNFGPQHSTENELLWTLKEMGHPVTTFQENGATTEEINAACCQNDTKLLLYIHTHGWTTPGEMTLDQLWKSLRAKGIGTASFHLDRYWGLNQADSRETRIGQHPFWRTDAVFTADGGNQDRFIARGVTNHYWLPPGVVARDCYFGEAREDLACDVGFVGATGYHPEYPFRQTLIEFLKAVYGDRFRVFQGYRGKDLNDVYASVKVVVGDSCFGGADRYWSDRVPETLGRGGFLLHPASRGLTIPGLVTFEPGNLVELQDRIDYYLENWEERRNLVRCSQAWVMTNETYTNRMQYLLKIMGVA